MKNSFVKRRLYYTNTNGLHEEKKTVGDTKQKGHENEEKIVVPVNV